MSSIDLFQPQGRLNPKNGERVYQEFDRNYFRLTQPSIDYSQIFRNLTETLGADIFKGFSAKEFENRADNIRSVIMSDLSLAPLFSGVHVPFVFPKLSDSIDLGGELEKTLLPAVGKSFLAKFPNYEFKNYCVNLENSMAFIKNTNFQNVINPKTGDFVVGWYFPTALAGYAIPDQRTLISRLPSNLALSGPVEVSYSFIGTPELLMKTDDNYPNLLALSSVEPIDKDQKHFFWYFEAYGWNLYFNKRSMVGAVSEYYSGGLTIVG
jgi:hypothetical protein